MQGSFWKTVAIVGVIGIGGLAVLEVQKRLDERTAQEQPAGADALAQQILAQGEASLEPELTASDFDQMMASASEPQFSMSEPGFTPDTDASPEAAFFSSEPVNPQANTPPVDHRVHAEQLVQGGNPFAETHNDNHNHETQTAQTAVAANYQSADTDAASVTQVAFQDEPTTTTTSDESLEPFRRDGVAQAQAPSVQPEEFPLFPSDSGNATETTATSNPTPAGDSVLKATPNRQAPMEFFAGNEQPAASPKTQQTAQFYSELGESNEAPAFDAPSTTPAPVSGINEPQFQPFPDDVDQFQSDQTLKPTPRGNGGDPFDSSRGDRVPEPRDPGFNPGFGDTDSSIDRATRSQPAAGNDALPFVEDAPATNVPTLESDSSILSIPMPDRSVVPQAQPDRVFEMPEQFQPDSPLREDRSFPVMPEPDALPHRVESVQPFQEDLNAVQDNAREFPADLQDRGNDLRRNLNNGFDSLRDNAREFTPEPRDFAPDTREFTPNYDNRGSNFDDDARTFPSNSREFSPGPPGNRLPSRDIEIRPLDRTEERREFNTDTRTYPIDEQRLNMDSDRYRDQRTNRRTELRQVSGVMRPNLILEKEAPKNATVGTPLDYNIYVRNEGDATAYEVVVEDDVTSGARVDAASPAASRDRQTNKLVWEFDEIAPKETKTITVRITPTGEGMLDGIASVKFKSRVKATTVITAPKLRIQMTGPDEVRMGEEVPYRYVITNEGSGEARDVFVRTLLPADGGLRHPAGRDLEYEITSLKPAEQREIVLSVVAAEAGEHRVQAEVTAAGGAQDQAAWRTNIIGAQLRIDRRGPKRRFVGRAGTYENIISNETNFDAVDARVVEQVPEGMRFVSASKGGNYNPADRTVTWRINRLLAGKVETLQVELMPTTAGQRESIVTIFENAGIRSEDFVSTTQVEDLHNVSADISQLDGPVAVGETFGFTISIDNRGTADATDVELSVSVPSEIKVVGAGSRDVPAKLLEGNEVQYNLIVRIEPDQHQEFELKLQGTRPIRNGVVKASVQYKQMSQPLVISESVTVYRDDL